MQVVVTAVLTAIATSGWWYFSTHIWPETGIMVLPAAITVLSTIAVVMIVGFTIVENWFN